MVSIAHGLKVTFLVVTDEDKPQALIAIAFMVLSASIVIVEPDAIVALDEVGVEPSVV